MLVIKLIYASFLRNQRAGKFRKFTKLNSSAYSHSKNEKFVNTSKKLLKTRYQTFSVMRFFTYKVFPNILSTTLTLKKRKCKQKNSKTVSHYTVNCCHRFPKTTRDADQKPMQSFCILSRQFTRIQDVTRKAPFKVTPIKKSKTKDMLMKMESLKKSSNYCAI